jgi:hypothetical protein
MRKSSRYITSLLMTIIYLVIVFSPLAPLAMQSQHIAHAVTGECSGNCEVDGCSLERSAAHACCCWQKKKHVEVDAHLHSEDDNSSMLQATTTITPKKRASCCDASVQKSPEKTDSAPSASTSAPNNTRQVTIGSIPCGSGKLFAILSVETTQHLPFFFTGDTHPSPEQSPLYFFPQDRLTSRYTDPPEPPPQNS